MEQKNILGGLKNVVGNKNSDLVLESLGKIYAKFGDKSYLLNDLFQSLDTTSTSNESTIKTVENLSEISSYPGDNIFIFEKSTKNLYFTKNDEYLPLINNSDVTGYLTNPLNEPLEITTRKAPLVVNSTQLVKNLNTELLGGYSHESYPKKANDETIKGNWTFEGVNKAKESWTFEKHLAIGGSLISTRGFAPGYSGYGWMLDADTNTLTIDNLIVRKILSVYELVVNKISATNGSLWVSNAGKVETAYKISVTPTSTVSLPFSDIDTTPQVFDDYTNTYFSKDNVVTSDTFTINSLLISEELTTEILSSKKLILNSNNVRKFLYLYYNYYGGNFFLIKLDEEGSKYPPFKVGDILRNQKFINNGIRYYDALVTNVNYEEGFFVIRLANSIFDNYNSVILDENGNLVNTTEETANYYSDSTRNPNTVFVDDLNQSVDTGTEGSPVEGDNLVQIGSISDTNRKNAIYITSTDDRAPYIDVLSGIDRPDYSVILKEIVLEGGAEVIKTPNMLKCRLGRLDGIYEPSFKLKQPHGFGLYSDNVFLKGEFYLENGDTLVNFDENKIYLKYKDAGLEISDNSLGEPVLKLFGDQIEFWSGKSGSANSVKLMSLTTLFNSDGSKINDSLINADGILALLDVNGIIQSKGLIIKEGSDESDELFNELVYDSTLCIKHNNSWILDANLNTYNTWEDLIEVLNTTGNTQGTFIRILDGTNVPSISTLYKKGDVITTKHGRNTKVIVFLDVFTSEPNYYELTVKYDKLSSSNIKLVDVYDSFNGYPNYKPGYYIFRTNSNLPINLTANNISRYDDTGRWYNYLSYDSSPEVLDVNFKIKDDIGCFISTRGKFYANGAEINGTINATGGTIGGLRINSNSIGINKTDVKSDGSGSSGMFLYSDMIGFNKSNRQVILGPTNFLASYDYLCTMTDYRVDLMGAIGLNVGVTKRVTDNIAINITGGYIAGINYKTKVYGFEEVEAETGAVIYDIDRDVNMVIASTEYTVKGEKHDRDVYLNLPEMRNCDDGHILKIKRGINNGSKVYVVNGKTNWTTYTYDPVNHKDVFTEHKGYSYIYYNGSDYVYPILEQGNIDKEKSSLAISSEGDAMEFVYIKGLYSSGGTQGSHGCWVQFKNPREW